MYLILFLNASSVCNEWIKDLEEKKALWLDHWKSSLGKGNWIIIYMFFPLWPFSYIIVRFRIHGCDLVFYFQSAFLSLLAYRATCNIPLPQWGMVPQSWDHQCSLSQCMLNWWILSLKNMFSIIKRFLTLICSCFCIFTTTFHLLSSLSHLNVLQYKVSPKITHFNSSLAERKTNT